MVECCRFWNFQVLTVKDNLSKSATFDEHLAGLHAKRKLNCEGKTFAEAIKWLQDQPDDERYNLMPKGVLPDTSTRAELKARKVS